MGIILYVYVQCTYMYVFVPRWNCVHVGPMLSNGTIRFVHFDNINFDSCVCVCGGGGGGVGMFASPLPALKTTIPFQLITNNHCNM